MKFEEQNPRRIAIIAALPGELKPLVHDWHRSERNLWTGTIKGHAAVAIVGTRQASARRNRIRIRIAAVPRLAKIGSR